MMNQNCETGDRWKFDRADTSQGAPCKVDVTKPHVKKRLDPAMLRAATECESPRKHVIPPRVKKSDPPVVTPTLNPVVLPPPPRPPSPPSPPVVPTTLWYEKYRPKLSSELIGNVKKVQQIREWISERGRHDPHSRLALFLYGPPGVGKTTAASLLLTEAGYSIYEINASEERTYESLARSLSETVLTRGAKGKVAVILDEIDGAYGGDDNHLPGVKAVIEFVNRTKKGDENRLACPIICIANETSSAIIRELKDCCKSVMFFHPFTRDVYPLIERVQTGEGFRMTSTEREWLLQSSDGDMRRMMNILQLSYQHQINGRVSQVGLVINSGESDMNSDIFKLTRDILARCDDPPDFIPDAAPCHILAGKDQPLSREPVFNQDKHVVRANASPAHRRMRFLDHPLLSSDATMTMLMLEENVLPLLSTTKVTWVEGCGHPKLPSDVSIRDVGESTGMIYEYLSLADTICSGHFDSMHQEECASMVVKAVRLATSPYRPYWARTQVDVKTRPKFGNEPDINLKMSQFFETRRKQKGLPASSKTRRCAHAGCPSVNPPFNYEDDPVGLYCKFHRQADMVDVSKQPRLTWKSMHHDYADDEMTKLGGDAQPRFYST